MGSFERKIILDNTVLEAKECCTARDVLWYLVFVGFAVNYMIRINLNIAIVAMIQAKPKDNVSLTSECLASELSRPVLVKLNENLSVSIRLLLRRLTNSNF